MDLIAGDTAGNVTLFRNIGAREKPELAKGLLVEADGKPITATRETYKVVNKKAVVDKVTEGSSKLAEVYSKIHMADWDGDGLKDLLVGHSTTIVFYKNVGTASAPRFKSPVALRIPEGNFPSRPSPYVVDWDGDGKKDLLAGTESDKVLFYRNVGTDTRPKLDRAKKLDLQGKGFDDGYRCRVEVADWNNDGKMDLLVGNIYSGGKAGGNVWLFLAK
jgi:hypothetical protein